MLLAILLACDVSTLENARITLSEETLDFAEVPVGEEALLELTVGNRGRARLLVDVLGPQLSSSVFEPDAWSLDIGPGDEQVLGLYFHPVEIVASTDQLVLSTNDLNQPIVSLPMTGVGTAPPSPEILLTPDQIDFGEVDVGDSARNALELANTGDAPLSVSGWTLRGSTAFTLSPDPSGRRLEPGESIALEVQYTPLGGSEEGSTEGDWANLFLLSDDPERPEAVVFVSGNR